MRTPNIPEQGGLPKEKKQLLILGVLAVVLGLVMVTQLGQDGSGMDIAELVEDPVAAAATSSQAGQRGSSAGRGNEVLSASGSGALNDGVFESFWSLAAPVEAKVEESPPPPITVNATLLGGHHMGAMAVIDGTLRHIGDTIGGWLLDDVRGREVTLRSPSHRLVTVAMPLLDLGIPRAPMAWPAVADQEVESLDESADNDTAETTGAGDPAHAPANGESPDSTPAANNEPNPDADPQGSGKRS